MAPAVGSRCMQIVTAYTASTGTNTGLAAQIGKCPMRTPTANLGQYLVIKARSIGPIDFCAQLPLLSIPKRGNAGKVGVPETGLDWTSR